MAGRRGPEAYGPRRGGAGHWSTSDGVAQQSGPHPGRAPLSRTVTNVRREHPTYGPVGANVGTRSCAHGWMTAGGREHARSEQVSTQGRSIGTEGHKERLDTPSVHDVELLRPDHWARPRGGDRRELMIAVVRYQGHR